MNARSLAVALAVVAAFAVSGCNCGWFALGEHACEGLDDTTSCPTGRTCTELSNGEFFCVLTDGMVPPTDGPPCLCDNGDPCDGIETCDATGGCVPGTPVDCTGMDDECNAAACDTATGMCALTPLADGTPCDDGLFCTLPDACETGVCTGPPRDCSGIGDPCSATCDEATDSCNMGMPVPDGSACNDGLFCTTGETCIGGMCGGSTPRDCSAVDDDCNMGACNDTTDLCEAVARPAMTPCDDGLFCTDGDLCVGGACMPGPARDCSGMTLGCNVGMCDDAGDVCGTMPAPDATPCNDGDDCTMGSTCTGGMCGGGMPEDCSGLDDMCNVGMCTNPGGCFANPVMDGTMCDDMNPGTSMDQCTGGVCMGTVMTPETICNDLIDNEGDGLVDYFDPDCGACGANCSSSTCCGDSCTASTCNFTCDNSTSCTLLCPGVSNECNPTCSASPDCNADCTNSETCNPTCTNGSTCFFDCTGATNCNPTCNGGSTCVVDCSGVNSCDITCNGGASCTLICDGATNSCGGCTGGCSCMGPGC